MRTRLDRRAREETDTRAASEETFFSLGSKSLVVVVALSLRCRRRAKLLRSCSPRGRSCLRNKMKTSLNFRLPPLDARAHQSCHQGERREETDRRARACWICALAKGRRQFSIVAIGRRARGGAEEKGFLGLGNFNMFLTQNTCSHVSPMNLPHVSVCVSVFV